MEPAPAPAAPTRGRKLAARLLVVLAAVIGVVALLAGYVRYQALDTETFRDTAGELIADPEIRDQVAVTLVDRLYADVDVAASLEERLPPDQQALAAPLAGALRELTERAALRLFERPEVEQLWVETVSFSHQELISVLEDDVGGVETEEGVVFLDLRPLIVELGERLEIVARIATQLDEDAGRIRVVEADQLQTAQDVTRLLDVVGSWLWVVPLLLVVAAVAIARGERLRILRWVAVSTILMGLVVLLLRRLAGNYVVDSVADTNTVETAARDAWSILTQLLAEGAWTVIGIGVVLLIGTWLAGESSSARATRTELAPLIARPELAFGVAALLFLGLLLWAPTAQTTRVPQMLALAALLALAVAALRRQTAREHPDARADDLGEYARGRWARLRGTG